MPNYDVFAKYYDPIMGDSQDTTELIQSLIDEYAPKTNSILELAVGTGSVLMGLEDKYEVAGLDLSEEMLKVAKEKVPSAELFKADMSDFDLGRTYDVIFCVFDSVNHLDTFKHWVKMFKCVKKHLNEGGLFIFDMNTTSRLKKLAYGKAYEQLFQGGKLVMDVNPVEKTTYEWHVQIYDDKTGKRYEERINESSYNLKRVRRALEKDFKLLSWFDSFSEEPDERADRVFFVCTPE